MFGSNNENGPFSVQGGPPSCPSSGTALICNNPSDPYYDPGNWNRNSNMGHFGGGNRGPYPMQNPGFGDGWYIGNDYQNVNDRNSKRLRLDGFYPGDANWSSKLPFEDNERRLRLVRDHGGPNLGFVFSGNNRGHAVGANEFGVRPSINMETSRLHYQGDKPLKRGESLSNVEHVTLANASKFQNDDQYLARYSQVPKLPDPTRFRQGGGGHDNDCHSHVSHHSNYAHSHGATESFYDSNMHSNNVLVHHDQRSNMQTLHHYSSSNPSFATAMHQPDHMRYNYGSPRHFSDIRQSMESRPPPFGCYQAPGGTQNVPTRPHYAVLPIDYQGGYGNSTSENMGYSHASQRFDVQPPLPPSLPPPLPMEPPVHWSAEHKHLSSPSTMASTSLFPVPVSSSASVHSSHPPIPEPNTPVTPHLQNSQLGHTAHGMFRGDHQGTLTSYGQCHRDGQTFPSKNNFPDKPKVIDAVHLFKLPHRTSRPDHFVIILRGLPGSGKSYLAKMLRDLEVEHGGNAPRIHSMDDYFMTEVEKIEENESLKSSARGKKSTMKKVLEYCYEPEMEEAYRSSMLKAFKKTLEEGAFTFVIVDDRNLRVADFAQFWATAKRSGYEVYLLEAPYKDPAGCTARNVHGFTQADVEKMAAQWEDAPSLYLQVDIKCLFQGDELKESNIQEVDMDTEDGDIDGSLSKSEERGVENIVTSSAGILELYDGGVDSGDRRMLILEAVEMVAVMMVRRGEEEDGEGCLFSLDEVSHKEEGDWDAEVNVPTEEVKDLGRSKWSDNLDENDDERTEVLKRKANVLSGLVKKNGRQGKSVHWGDQGKRTGFSIGAVKKANLLSLVIGPGAGYNLKSNPLSEEEAKSGKSRETKRHNTFQERLRAEQESFRAVFDRRRQRIDGLDVEED
ncbi:YLP motif-containing protein 1 [Bienertia sinuspersici]